LENKRHHYGTDSACTSFHTNSKTIQLLLLLLLLLPMPLLMNRVTLMIRNQRHYSSVCTRICICLVHLFRKCRHYGTDSDCMDFLVKKKKKIDDDKKMLSFS
jgi:hypothetical protein